MHLDRMYGKGSVCPGTSSAPHRQKVEKDTMRGHRQEIFKDLPASPNSLFPIIRSHLKFPEPSKSTTSWRIKFSKYESVKNISYSNHDSTHADITLLSFSGLIIWLGLTLKLIAEDSVWRETLLSEGFHLGLKHAFTITENKLQMLTL